MIKNNKRELHGWVMYDWANSVYSLTITTAIFPIYFESSVKASHNNSESVDILGFSLPITVIYTYILSLSFLLVSILTPILSGMADYAGNKKSYMRAFAFLGSFSCMSLYFFTGDNLYYGIFCAILASVGFAGSLVFYNSYLPEIATPDKFDRLSARGFSMGYIGSVIHLIFALALITQADKIGITSGFASRISFFTVGLWWLVFSIYSLMRLPADEVKHNKINLTLGFAELRNTWNKLKSMNNTRKFLLAFFFYNLSVQTVMYLATLFASKELLIPSESLIPAVLIIQLVAIGGAILFSRLSNSKGNIFSLNTMILVWLVICTCVFLVNGTDANKVLEFYGLAAGVGLVMGGIQSLSRATYSKLLPDSEAEHTAYFSFYDVVEKVSIVMGTFVFGLTEQLTGSMRNSIIPLMVSFVVGLLVLQSIKDSRLKALKNA